MQKETQFQAEMLKQALRLGLATPQICVDWAKKTLASPMETHPSLIILTKPQETESYIENLQTMTSALSQTDHHTVFCFILGRIFVVCQTKSYRLKGFAYKLKRFFESVSSYQNPTYHALLAFDNAYSMAKDESTQHAIDLDFLAFLSAFKNDLSTEDNWFLYSY